MRFVLERVTNPEIEPVSLTEMKLHLGEFDDITTRDDEVSNVIAAAREWAEDFTGRALIDQTWRISFGEVSAVESVAVPTCACGPSEARGTEILLRKSPVLSVISFKSVDADGAETDVDAANYELREAGGKWPRVVAKNGAAWRPGIYRIVFRAGYADRDVSPQEGAEAVPNRFKQAMKLWIEANYDREKDMMQVLLDTAASLIRSERVEIDLA